MSSDRGAIHVATGVVWGVGGVASAISWAAVFAQDVLPVAGDNVPTTVLGALAAAITAQTGAIGWLLRRFFSGEWVKIEQAETVETLKQVKVILERLDKREQALLDGLIQQRKS